MLIKDLIRELNSIKKKHPESPVFIFGDSNDLECIQHVVVCYVDKDLVQNNGVTSDACTRNPSENSVPIIAIG